VQVNGDVYPKLLYTVDYQTSKIYQKLFRHFDLTMFYKCAMQSLIAKVTFLHHRMNKIKHCLVIDLNWYNLI